MLQTNETHTLDHRASQLVDDIWSHIREDVPTESAERIAARAAELLSGFSLFYELRDLFADLRCRVQIAAVAFLFAGIILAMVFAWTGIAEVAILAAALLFAALVLWAFFVVDWS